MMIQDPRKKYKTILFDSDQTLLDFSRSEEHALRRSLDHFHIFCDDSVIETYRSCNRDAWLLFEQGKMRKDEIVRFRFEMFCRQYDLSIPPEQLNAYYMDRLCETGFVLDGTVDVLQAIYDRYTLYIVTNGVDRIQRARLNNAGITHFFKTVFTSEEIGAGKPSAAFFEKVFDRIPFSKEQALLVGDSLTSDIRGGIAFGVDTCFVNWNGAPHNDHPTYEVRDLRELLKLL